jgi:branched-chain amino acid transport system substrate-binding protein
MCKIIFSYLIVFFSFPVLCTHLEAQEKIKIGVILPLSGPAADYGKSMRNGLQLALKENNNERPQKEIQLVYEDVQYNPVLAVLAFKKLAQRDKVDFVVSWGVNFCEALAPVAESLQIPFIGLCLNPHIAQNKKYVIRFQNVIDELMRLQASYLASQGKKRIAVLLADNA